jgi:hypothetical protein
MSVEKVQAHFDLESWSDFARGVAEPALRAAMESHLATGCPRCITHARTLGRLAVVAGDEKKYEVPAYAVRAANALFALRKPAREPLLQRMLAHLTFDSFSQPLAAGVRGQQRVSRQTLHEAGPYSIDLRVEQERGASHLSLVGQIFDRTNPDSPIGHVPVILASKTEVLKQVESNEFGEFQLEHEPRQQLRLVVPIQRAGTQIDINLDEATLVAEEAR